MNKNLKLIIGTFAIIVVGFAAASIFVKKEETQRLNANRIPLEKLVKPYSPWTGNPDAKVVVVEFLDPECEACAAYHPMIKGIINDYKDKIKFVVRYMLFHSSSKEAALATEAAGRQGKYWEMQAQLFHRTDWTHQESPRIDIFEDVAKNLELNLEQFRKDMKDPELLKNILADYEEGKAIGVKGTPTVYVNGIAISGLTYETLKARIEEELNN